ncbi:hypothetical protein [Nonomuraea harbinensis]|uniref:DUF1648 domain-containing protein n=1 Tax=Nonomuraea harbinensis TaxID=1286938 RepID=A0ABW1BSN8_9ACTN|nr:hypothetical protein [Nonomuraea harbinensis]
MNQAGDRRHEFPDSQAARMPWPGIVASAAGFLAMVAIAYVMWDHLPEYVATREATATRPGVDVPRIVIAGALPAVLLLIGAVMTVSTIIGGRLRHFVDPTLVASPSSQTRTMNVLFSVLPLLLVTLQAGLLSRAARYDFPLEQAVGVAFGILLIGLGNVLPKISPARVASGVTGRWALAWQRSQRTGGVALMVLGTACVAGSFFFPPVLLVVGSALLVAAVYALMAVLAVMRMRRS